MRRERTWWLALVFGVALCAASAAQAGDKHALIVYTALFDQGSAAVGVDDGTVLKLLGQLMKGESEYEVRVIAYTDPVDEDDDDEKLAKSRAKAVRELLVAAGADQDDVEIKARGDEKGFGRDDAANDRALRRRVEVRVRQKDADRRAVDSDLADDTETRLQTTVFFDFDKAEIRPEFQGLLAKLGAMLHGDPAHVVRVFGHTDGIGSPAYNQALGHRRCAAVIAALAAAGANAGALEEASLGEGEAIGSQRWQATTSRALSRSVEIKVLDREGHEADDEEEKQGGDDEEDSDPDGRKNGKKGGDKDHDKDEDEDDDGL